MRMVWAGILLAAGLYGQSGYRYYLTGNGADVRAKTQPGVLLAGGGRDVDAACRWFLSRAGGGDVLVLRASGADGYHSYFQGLAPVDSVETIVFESSAAARDAFVLERIRNAEAIFLAGGDQWNYIRLWHGTPVAAALNDAIRRGVPVGGTSAGLAVLGEFAFSAERDTVTSAEALADPYHEKVALHRGLLAVPGLACLITDSHFLRRERMGRLLVFLARMGGERGCAEARGIGIDERTAVALDGEGRAVIFGAGKAHLVRLRAAAPQQRGKAAEIPWMELTAMTGGTVFDWEATWRERGQCRIRVRGGRMETAPVP
jgi:cyanophycinase